MCLVLPGDTATATEVYIMRRLPILPHCSPPVPRPVVRCHYLPSSTKVLAPSYQGDKLQGRMSLSAIPCIDQKTRIASKETHPTIFLRAEDRVETISCYKPPFILGILTMHLSADVTSST